ncbi:MAG: hypothetical protein R3275_01585 [Saprospiraceae bacterium]|nr:hypothetical protein [Saprospiraceae bacterium]
MQGVIASCIVDNAPDFDPEIKRDKSLEIAKDVEIRYSDSARLKAKILGEVMRRSVDRTNPFDEFDEGVVVHFYDERGQAESHLYSEYAIRYEKKGVVIARDPEGVILTNNSGDSLISTELIWLNEHDKITTDKFVYIRTADRKIWGQGFESNMDFTRGKIKAVEGELQVEDFTPSQD